jgi:uncharacterized membrane protein
MIVLIFSIIIVIALVVIIVHFARKNVTGSKIVSLNNKHSESEILEKGTVANGIADKCAVRKATSTEEYGIQHYIVYVRLENNEIKRTIKKDITINNLGQFLNKNVQVKFIDDECVITSINK